MAEEAEKAKADKDAFMSENETLKKYKEDVETEKFEAEVNKTISEVSENMPKDKMKEIIEDSKNFSLETVDGWKNKVKAMAFEFAKKPAPDDGITRIDMGWLEHAGEKVDVSKGWVK
jgi:hypothetical protein